MYFCICRAERGADGTSKQGGGGGAGVDGMCVCVRARKSTKKQKSDVMQSTGMSLPLLSLPSVLLVGIPLLLFVQLNPLFPPWGSRTVLHIGTGAIVMCMDVSDPLNVAAVLLVTAVVWATVPFGDTFHFASRGDVGILAYLSFCSLAVLSGVPFWRMAPFFLADPAGAIVGRNVSSPKLVGSKSVGGTAAVWFVASLCTLDASLLERAVVGGLVAGLELCAGEWDNVAIGAFLMGRSLILEGTAATT